MHVIISLVLFIPLVITITIFAIVYIICQGLAIVVKQLLDWMMIKESKIVKNNITHIIEETKPNDNKHS